MGVTVCCLLAFTFRTVQTEFQRDRNRIKGVDELRVPKFGPEDLSGLSGRIPSGVHE